MSRRSCAEREAMATASRLLDLDPVGARLVSDSSRLIWHLPRPGIALTISRPGTKQRADLDAETAAMRAASAAGARTPRLRCGPVAVPSDRWAFASDWITGRRPGPDDWPAIAAAAARFAEAPTVGLLTLAWPEDLDTAGLGGGFPDRFVSAGRAFAELVATAPPVFAHTDLQPANVLCDDTGVWLLDLEYAALAPREWDPAKLAILARRFGDPPQVDGLLGAWPGLEPGRLQRCVEVQEVLLVAWLARMADRGTPGAAREARHRAATLGLSGERWHHLALTSR
jgi:hypothetical protein